MPVTLLMGSVFVDLIALKAYPREKVIARDKVISIVFFMADGLFVV